MVMRTSWAKGIQEWVGTEEKKELERARLEKTLVQDMLVSRFMKQGLLLAALLFAQTTWADGYIWFSTREEGKVDAPFWPGFPEFRAGLFEVEVKGGIWEWKALYPQTSFQAPPFRMEYGVGWYVHPVRVRVPDKEPGEEVTLVVRWFDGEAIQPLGQGPPVGVKLGTKDQPAVLEGMQGATRTGGYDTFGPWYEDYQFQTVLAKNAEQGKILSVLLREDGSVVIVGDFTEVNGQKRVGIARVGEKGRLDEAFESPLPQDFKVNSAALDAQGSIALGGEFRFPEGVKHLVRLRSDGRLDEGFEATVTNEVTALAVQPDGKVVVGVKGERTEVLRVKADGKEDETFQRSAFTRAAGSAQIHAIRIANTDTIWVGGDFEARNGIESGSFVQLAEDGTLEGDAGDDQRTGLRDRIECGRRRVLGGQWKPLLERGADYVVKFGVRRRGPYTQTSMGPVFFKV
jgi:hypothetical protein